MPRPALARLWEKLVGQQAGGDTVDAVRRRLDELRDLVDKNNQVLEMIAQAGEMLGGEYVFDRNTLADLARRLEQAARAVVYDLNAITGDRYPQLVDAVKRIDTAVRATLESRLFVPEAEPVLPLENVGEELADVVGEKMARLGALKRLHGRLVPEGFVITAHACQSFLEHARVPELIERWLLARDTDPTTGLDGLATSLEERILASPLPKPLARALRSGLATLRRKTPISTLAVRSSAIGEDGEHSFAGQYETVLGVKPRDLVSAFRKVMASLFSLEVMRYRERAGLDPSHGAMAVGCLAMVDARSSGVVYTVDPASHGHTTAVVAAARGLGRAVVEGSSPVDHFELTRAETPALVASHVAEKQEMIVVGEHGLERRRVPADEALLPSVSEDELRAVVLAALKVERYMKLPQDVEWAIDAGGTLSLLQARPLRLSEPASQPPPNLVEVLERYEVLMRGRGVVACRGIGAGRVCLVSGDVDCDSLTSDVVLVARTSSPRLAAAVARASAVITDIGAPTGHLAAIAREFRVPTIVDTEIATQLLRGAGEVTVDAEENVVYAGRVNELLDYSLMRQRPFSDATEFRLLRLMLRRIAPLSLTDPRAANFFPQHCSTYHDVIRFAHEKAMEELAEGHRFNPRPGAQHVRRLDLPIPLDLIVIDLGGGLENGESPVMVKPGRVASRPLSILLEGLSTAGVWATGPADMDLNGFMSSMTRSQALTDQPAMRPHLNVAVVSKDYLNLTLRLGYHFNIVDTFLSEARSDNYIYFRFVGGVTEPTRRNRRAALLRRILEANDFVVEGAGDLVIGRIKKVSVETMVDRLRMIGRLIGFTRQLDILLRDDALIDVLANGFLGGTYSVTDLAAGLGAGRETMRKEGGT